VLRANVILHHSDYCGICLYANSKKEPEVRRGLVHISSDLIDSMVTFPVEVTMKVVELNMAVSMVVVVMVTTWEM
jgi:hypothetical protein